MVVNAPVLVDVDGNELLERNDGVAQHGCLDLHAFHEEEDTCISYAEGDICMSCEEEDTCMSWEEEDTCMSYEEEDTMHVT